MSDVPQTKHHQPVPARGNNSRAIAVTCSTCGGAAGFTNLMVSKRDGGIVLDPHVAGSCVIILALRPPAEEFGATCRRAEPDEPPMDLAFPPGTPVGHRLSDPDLLLVADRFPHPWLRRRQRRGAPWRTASPDVALPDIALLERVLTGLRRLR